MASFSGASFSTSSFSPASFDFAVVVEEVLTRGGGVPRRKRKREDTEYVPPEFNLDEAVDALFREKPAPAEVLVEPATPQVIKDFEVARDLFKALEKPIQLRVPDFSAQLLERDDEEAILLLLH